MKVAVLISGYLRSFKSNIDNLKTNIINNFDEVDIYIHITKNESNEDRYYNINNIDEDVKFINKELNPICILIEPNLSNNNLINQWVKYYKLNKLKCTTEEITNKKYDLVIKYRPDISFVDENIFKKELNKNILYLPIDSKIDKSKLVNPTDKYLCDTFAYGSSDVMDYYFNIYKHLNTLSGLYGTTSETLLHHFLTVDSHYEVELLPINYKITLSSCNMFAIAGDSGSGKSTLGKILKQHFRNSFTLECDRYHKWERGNENWDTYTHLNPDANHIEKMSDDIFDLKIGKTIYHVDYDHSTGKFTEKENIDPSENIIVVGLHSLYTKDHTPYNLKIYIDTDKNLKNKWKIKRDVKERGYILAKVLNQIKKREEDYKKYVDPQKESSDIIINFFTDNNVDPTNIDEVCNIYLRLLIKNEYNVSQIINEIKIFNNIEVEEKNDRYEIIIKEYKPLPIFDTFITKSDDFYDYILFFILNLV